MSLYVNTNLFSLNAQKNVGRVQGKLGTSIERLSSGLRVNTAKDDAAGLAISMKMGAHIRSMNQGIRNAQDGISVVQTAEGGMNEIHNILTRMRELSQQSANGTLSSSDRTALNNEFNDLKSEINQFLIADGHKTLDFGTNSSAPCDYPRFAFKVAKAVSDKKADLGILICKSGNGMAMVANKLPNVRAAICLDKNVAVLSRLHNDANILVMGSEHLFDEPDLIIRSWLEAGFEGGRHRRRVSQIAAIEKQIGLCQSKSVSSKQKGKKRK